MLCGISLATPLQIWRSDEEDNHFLYILVARLEKRHHNFNAMNGTHSLSSVVSKQCCLVKF